MTMMTWLMKKMICEIMINIHLFWASSLSSSSVSIRADSSEESLSNPANQLAPLPKFKPTNQPLPKVSGAFPDPCLEIQSSALSSALSSYSTFLLNSSLAIYCSICLSAIFFESFLGLTMKFVFPLYWDTLSSSLIFDRPQSRYYLKSSFVGTSKFVKDFP